MKTKVNEPTPIHISNWADVLEKFEQFPTQRLTFDEEGDILDKTWIFRGLRDSKFKLAPSIERGGSTDSTWWATLEIKIGKEFKSRAQMHARQELIPTDEVTWLALMQHYGVPTRLLDFTFSPFVALYFAIRDADPNVQSVRIWAINASAIDTRFIRVRARARQEEHERSEKRGGKPRFSAASEKDILRDYEQARREAAQEVLTATGTFRAALNEQGCVCMTLPTSFNPRLASQQGVFLLNGAENLTFRDSLTKMMIDYQGWCKILDIDKSILRELEDRLFQMNIHEQSLFPDMEGLAGLIRQRMRLHWQ